MARKPRVQKPREYRKTFYVFCEGKSEKAYIEFLRQALRPSAYLLPIVGKSNISEKEINSHLCRRDMIADDKVFVMYDIDVPGMLERISAIKNVTPLLSNPCIELWFLLHFTTHTGHITDPQCNVLLEKYVKGYEKGIIQPVLYSALLNEMSIAIERARKLKTPNNPSTTIWHLLEELE